MVLESYEQCHAANLGERTSFEPVKMHSARHVGRVELNLIPAGAHESFGEYLSK